MLKKSLFLFRALAHVIGVTVALIVLYVLVLFGTSINFLGRHELLVDMVMPPVIVAASYAAWFYWRQTKNKQ